MAKSKMSTVTLDEQEVAAVLAGLRLLQLQPATDIPPVSVILDEIATGGGKFKPLDEEAIDYLCERVNSIRANIIDGAYRTKTKGK